MVGFCCVIAVCCFCLAACWFSCFVVGGVCCMSCFGPSCIGSGGLFIVLVLFGL